MTQPRCASFGCMMQRKWLVLAVTSVGVFMSFLDATIVNIAFPSIRSTFAGANLGELSWVINAYNIVFASLLVPAGRLPPPGRRTRGFLRGGGALLGRVCRVRARADRRCADSGSRGSGGGLGRARPDLARSPSARVLARA